MISLIGNWKNKESLIAFEKLNYCFFKRISKFKPSFFLFTSAFFFLYRALHIFYFRLIRISAIFSSKEEILSEFLELLISWRQDNQEASSVSFQAKAHPFIKQYKFITEIGTKITATFYWLVLLPLLRSRLMWRFKDTSEP